MKWILGLVAAVFSAGSAHAQSFRYDPNPPKSPPRHVEPTPVVRPPLTPFDRNMVPPGYAESKPDSGTVIDLSEPLSFGDPKPKKR